MASAPNENRPPAARGAFDRQLPHAPDAERAVLGAMLLEPMAIGEAILVFQDAGGAVFFFERHQKLYEQIVELWKTGKPVDGVVIKDELERRGVFESIGGYDYLGTLIGSVASAVRIRDYATIVRDKYLLRQLIRAAHLSMDDAFDDRQPTQEILDGASRRIFEVTERAVSGNAQALPDLIDDVFKKIEALDGAVLTGVPTGYYALDEMSCGLQPSELVIIAGRPSMGKTALGLNMAEHIALVEEKPVLFFSLEMSRQQVAQRILCSRARVDSHKLRRGRHDDRDMQRLTAVADQIRSKPLFVDDTSSLSILELRARARIACRKHGIKAIFVDYLQLMHVSGAESRQQEVSEISRGLKALAKEFEVPVVAMAQLNRKPADRTGNKPVMSDLRESGAIEQDADVIGLLHREAYYTRSGEDGAEEDNSAELIIAKQRNGPVGTVDLHFNRKFTRFDNPTVGAQYGDTYEAQNPRGDVSFP
jgi:replicative DNA helicase